MVVSVGRNIDDSLIEAFSFVAALRFPAGRGLQAVFVIVIVERCCSSGVRFSGSAVHCNLFFNVEH